MSYTSYSIIIREKKDKLSDLKSIVTANFELYNVREIYTPFSGIVCQADTSFESDLVQFSEKIIEKEIAYIEVDCFGGKCSSEGFIIKNGVKVFEQDFHHSAHKFLLQKLDPNFDSWFYYPFRRDFFIDKGGINGDILNFTFTVLCFTLFSDFDGNKDYIFRFADNEALLIKENCFELYFMKVNDQWTKVLGRIFNDSEETINDIKDLLEDTFLGIEYNFNIDNFETGENLNLASIGEDLKKECTSKSYRADAFNVRPFEYSQPIENDKKALEIDNKQNIGLKRIYEGEEDYKDEKEDTPKSFWKSIIDFLNGK
ncbi:hypothetical protein [Flavobacterium sp. ASV13]|uniref:hypothetical protein n=1 Tax=Flavobacterium sp. ASV13 TaxID=1506583 RepID=UPI00054EB905|nr:hypothetical protein [Flavobacterium sp. ASV13]